jgi:RHS repeat-associated protein
VGNIVQRWLPVPESSGVWPPTEYDCDNPPGGGGDWTFTYTSNNDLDVATDPLGNYVDYTYTNGNLTSEVAKNSSGSTLKSTCYTRNTAGQVTEIKESCSSSRLTKMEYNSNGDVTSIKSPRFSSQSTPKTTFTYDAAGRKLTQTNELGHTTTWTYNNLGLVLTVTGPVANKVTNTYDDGRNLKTVTDPLGYVTTFNYDNANRLTSVVDVASGTTSYAYDAAGNRTTVTNALSHATTSTYDARNRLSSVTDSLGTTNFTYDAASNLTEQSMGTLKTQYQYDESNRVTDIDYKDGTTLLSSVDYDYDDVGNRLQMIDSTGTTTYDYNDLYQIVEVDFPGTGNVVEYNYNAYGDRSRITYPDAKYVDYGYDAAHNLISVTDWLGKVTTYTYNNAGALTTTTLPASTGITTTRTYDNAERLTKVENKQGSTVLSSFEYTLSSVGTRTAMTTPTEKVHYGYDSLQRLTSVLFGTPGAEAVDDFQSGNFSGGSGWTGAWITSGSPTNVNSSGARYANMDTNESITRSVGVAGPTTRLQFRARATSLDSGEFAYAEVSPDGTNWTVLQTFDTNNDDNVWRTYSHDVSAYEDSGTLHVRFSIQSNSTGDDFEVDDVSVAWGSEFDTYTYDSVGNRLTMNTTSYTYGDADQMLTAGGVSYGYDARGNQTSRGSDTFTFDHENRMTAATIGGASSSYVYNGDGVRVTKTAASVTTNYVQDVASKLPMVLQDGTFTYVYGIGLISTTDGAGVQTYRLTDGLGSTTELVDGSGNVTVSYTYDPFGAVRSQSASNGNDWLFTGEQRDDESGYDFLRARYYDPGVGRFLGRDAARQGNNYYWYAAGNPLSITDPSGLWIVCDVWEEGYYLERCAQYSQTTTVYEGTYVFSGATNTWVEPLQMQDVGDNGWQVGDKYCSQAGLCITRLPDPYYESPELYETCYSQFCVRGTPCHLRCERGGGQTDCLIAFAGVAVFAGGTMESWRQGRTSLGWAFLIASSALAVQSVERGCIGFLDY